MVTIVHMHSAYLPEGSNMPTGKPKGTLDIAGVGILHSITGRQAVKENNIAGTAKFLNSEHCNASSSSQS